MNILFSFPYTGKYSKFYLQGDLIIFLLQSDIGVPHRIQKPPQEIFYKKKLF